MEERLYAKGRLNHKSINQSNIDCSIRVLINVSMLLEGRGGHAIGLYIASNQWPQAL